jgi:transcriptional regulator with XRE-family HTH domain
MNQDKISSTIKKIRKDNGLTQEAFANELNVTYQAVSKWENGKSIPDIGTLQLICNKYNIDINELLDTPVKVSKKNNNFIYIMLIVIVVIVGTAIGINIHINHKTFETRELGSSCKDFTINGTVSYDANKTHIYISDINYCGKEDNNVYKKIESILYSIHTDGKEMKMAEGDTLSNITLNNYLNELKFNTSSNTCSIMKGIKLKLVIKAYTDDNVSTTFEIPLNLGDTTC